MNYRLLPNGDIIFPHRGPPPDKDIPNYKKDPKDPYRYLPELPKCSYRQIVQIGFRPCGMPRFRESCTYDMTREICLNTCFFCEERKE